MDHAYRPVDGEIIERFAAIVGAGHAITAPADQAAYLTDLRDLYKSKTPLVLRPCSTAEVAAIASLANELGIPLVPQGGATGLVGGHIPVADRDEIIVSLNRLNRIRAIDRDGMTMVVEAGVTLQEVQAAAADAGLHFGLRIGSQGSCRIGGNLATNAGGSGVIAYGNARDLCLGLEVVLADGRIWDGLQALKKDNTGYDLKHLFVGSEGTLGMITASVLRLHPKPAAQMTAFVGLSNPSAALILLNRLMGAAAGTVTGIELMPRLGLDLALRHGQGLRDPLATNCPWYVLIELSGSGVEAPLRESLETILGAALEDGVASDATIAASLADAEAFWLIRETIPLAQRADGGSIKHDVAVPVAAVPALIEEGVVALKQTVPGCRPLPFGHLGDGNIHFNVMQPENADKQAFLAEWNRVNAVLHAIVLNHRGSISAEHGIGQLKRHLLEETKSPVELDMMRRIKSALDPNAILNPGKLI